jgi:GT2 family glycosyltransferase
VKFAVIIVNFNSGRLLGECLRCLQKQTRQADRIVIVDNASDDGSLSDIPALQQCEIIRLSENSGFAAASNIGFQHSHDADFFITLNPDAFPAPDFLHMLEQAAQGYPDYASYACRMMIDPYTLDGAGDCYHISGLAWRNLHQQPFNPEQHQPREVFAACAGAAMYRASAVRQAGGFDEAFFCYIEDIDLGYRLRLSGGRCLYYPDAAVTHLGSAIVGKYPGFAVYHGHRNLVWAMFKNTPTLLLLLMLPAHILMTIIMGVVYMSRGQSTTYWRAKRDALAGLGRVLTQRRRILALKRISNWELLKIYSVQLRRYS